MVVRANGESIRTALQIRQTRALFSVTVSKTLRYRSLQASAEVQLSVVMTQ